MEKQYKVGIGVVLFLALIIFLLGFQAYRDFAFICDHTGSREGYREWRFGVTTNRRYKKSPLEDFMQKNYPDILEHRWVLCSKTGRNIFGMKTLIACGFPGAITGLQHEPLEEWIQMSDPEEVLGLYQLLASDQDEEVKGQRICEISEEAIGNF